MYVNIRHQERDANWLSMATVHIAALLLS